MIDFNKASGVPKNTLDKVFKEYDDSKETIDLPALLAELGIDADMTDEDEWVAPCPLPSHGGIDANPSWAVNPHKMLYLCFKCGGGNMLMLTKEMQGLDWEEGMTFLRQFTDAGMGNERFAEVIDDILKKPQSRMPERTPELPWYPSRRLSHLFYSEEVAERGITEQVAADLGIGLDETYRKGSYCGRAIVIPHYFNGKLTGWQARLLDELPDGQPRHDNTHDLPKSLTLYGYDLALEDPGIVFVVESPMTVARLRSAGYVAVATFGATLSKEQIKLLRAFSELVLAFDNDAAGRTAEKRLKHELDEFSTLYLCPPVPGEKADLGDIEDDEALHAHIAKSRIY